MQTKHHTPEQPKRAPEVTIGTPKESIPRLATILDERMDEISSKEVPQDTPEAERHAVMYDATKQRQLLAREILEGSTALMA